MDVACWSDLVKDHDTHPFHTLAAALATHAVKTVGAAMAARWAGDRKADPGAVATNFLIHPFDCTWQDKLVAEWARMHPDLVKRGESATAMEAVRAAHEQEARKHVEQVRSKSVETWKYINKYYSAIFGETNQVKP